MSKSLFAEISETIEIFANENCIEIHEIDNSDNSKKIVQILMEEEAIAVAKALTKWAKNGIAVTESLSKYAKK